MSTVLESKYQPFIRVQDGAHEPNVPQLALEITAYMANDGAELCLTMPYRMRFHVTYRSDNPDAENLICAWGAFGCLANGHMVLLHEKSPIDLEPVKVEILQNHLDVSHRAMLDLDEVPMHNAGGVFTVAAGSTHETGSELTANYQMDLTPGETYHLLYPGGEINFWKFGHIPGTHAMIKRQPHPLILPPAGPLIFKVVETDEPFPDRNKYLDGNRAHRGFAAANRAESAWRWAQYRARSWVEPKPVLPSERIPGAPVLSLSIELASLSRAGQVVVHKKVTYEAASGSRSITFHTRRILLQDLGFYHLQSGRWREVEDHCFGASMIVDGPDEEVKVGGDHERSKHFVSLRPGETWIDIGSYDIDKQVGTGDLLKFAFKGAVIDWWDWGSKQDHADTAVTLPCWHGGCLQEPANNDGRPLLVIPGSNVVEFAWEEQRPGDLGNSQDS